MAQNFFLIQLLLNLFIEAARKYTVDKELKGADLPL